MSSLLYTWIKGFKIITFNSHSRVCFLILRERERNINQLPLLCAPTRIWTYNLGMSPDRECKHRIWCIGWCSNNWASRPGQKIIFELKESLRICSGCSICSLNFFFYWNLSQPNLSTCSLISIMVNSLLCFNLYYTIYCICLHVLYFWKTSWKMEVWIIFNILFASYLNGKFLQGNKLRILIIRAQGCNL